MQPVTPHQHWHVDISHLDICGTFYFLCSVLDGCSRFIVHWDIRTSMTETDVQAILQRARELHPGATPRIISDHGPQFIAKEFKAFIRLAGMTHVRTSPYDPQSNGKIERWHKALKSECLRPRMPRTEAPQATQDLGSKQQPVSSVNVARKPIHCSRAKVQFPLNRDRHKARGPTAGLRPDGLWRWTIAHSSLRKGQRGWWLPSCGSRDSHGFCRGH